MLGSLGWEELLVIVVILALLFGAQRVSSLGGALGKGIREFREEAKGSDKNAPAIERPAGMSDDEWVEYQEFKKQQKGIERPAGMSDDEWVEYQEFKKQQKAKS